MDFLVTLTLVVGILYWWDTARSKEVARMASKRACDEANVSLLDDTVALSGTWFKRNPQGTIMLHRRYKFEFTSDIDRRYSGEVIMLGSQVEHIDMDAYRMN